MLHNSKLVHGAIYRMTTDLNARCNICYQGTEIWFTDKIGRLVGGNPIQLIKSTDSNYKNNDVK